MRVMRSRLGQFGSGQAISASLVIQSFGMGRTLLGGQKRQHRRERIDRHALSRRQGQHLAVEFEIVARLARRNRPSRRGARSPRRAGPKVRSFRRSSGSFIDFRPRSRFAAPAHEIKGTGLQTIGGWSKINDQFGVMSGDGADPKRAGERRPARLVGEVSGQAFRRRRRGRRRLASTSVAAKSSG